VEMDIGNNKDGDSLIRKIAGACRQGTPRNERRRRRAVGLWLMLGVAVLANRDGRCQDRWNYNSSLSQKMQLFFPVYHQLKLIAVGDSRCKVGINPEYFDFPPVSNALYPQTINLAVGGAGIPMLRLVVETYALNCPRLEWIVVGLSPRMFNAAWDDWITAPVTGSEGYQYDTAHAQTIWEPRGEALVVTDPSQCCAGFNSYGYETALPDKAPNDPLGNITDPDAAERIRLLVSQPDFSYADDRMLQFEELLQTLAARGIKLLGFTPPMHYYIADQPCTDDNGTTVEGYEYIVARLDELAQQYDNFLFHDIDQRGRNDYADYEYYNYDHLNTKGAIRLTREVNRLIREHLALPDSVGRVSLIVSVDSVSTGRTYRKSFIDVGHRLYTDADTAAQDSAGSRVREMPAILRGSPMIQTAYEDWDASAREHIGFSRPSSRLGGGFFPHDGGNGRGQRSVVQPFQGFVPGRAVMAGWKRRERNGVETELQRHRFALRSDQRHDKPTGGGIPCSCRALAGKRRDRRRRRHRDR
jgi:hypothetical protein